MNFIFTDSKTLDITNEDQIKEFFTEHKPDFCINASAYTAVRSCRAGKKKKLLQ